ncbi:porin [Vibrio cholerae]|uniref:porin n=1 Tax=Vibrio cholerae TaxID=666 RepID=UPI000BA97C94|nr:porin [Vibrio cholerae]EIA3112827.1 porin [Vibrio cholerae]EIY4766854.1 porin [Vibrio cholerae]EJL6526853.1 porin [Vibrio cholerae]EJL6549036.1 porin [Vibrio cholerae]EKF9487631.1 porin [Vibrio cholerae]
MDKMFKRTLLASAVAMVAAAGSANAAIDLNGKAVQVYGQAAGGLIIQNPSEGDSSVIADLESRIGFRGVVEYENFAPDLIWQIESGNANGSAGSFGVRDTFVGLAFDGVGSIKYGRQLVAAYNYVDWPHSNPGLGGVFDRSWAPDVGGSYQDRADHVLRFDSETFGGFNFQATLSGMDKTTEALVASIAASVQLGSVNLHGGYYAQGSYDEAVAATKDSVGIDNGLVVVVPGEPATTKKAGDMSYGIVGATWGIDSFTLTGAVKFMDNGVADSQQTAYSATAQYVMDNQWVYKLGVAASDKVETKGKTVDNTDDLAITGRLGYLLPSTYLYLDVRYADMNGSTKNADGTNIHIGAEYYF